MEAERRIKQVMAEVLEIDPAAIREGFQREEASSWDSNCHICRSFREISVSGVVTAVCRRDIWLVGRI